MAVENRHMMGGLLRTTGYARGVCAVAVVLCVGNANVRSADIIATAEISGGGGSHFIGNSVQLYVSNGGATNGGGAAIFDSFTFTAAQLGQTFSVDQTVDAQFSAFVSRLTNGFNDQITRISKLTGGGESGLLTSEASFFSTRPAGGNGIDLAGFTIDRIDMTINQISIESPGSNLSGDGNWTDYSIQATLSFIGSQVPEPTGAALIFAGLVCMGFGRRLKPGGKRKRSGGNVVHTITDE